MQAIEKRNSLFNSLTQAIFDKEMANFWLQKVNPLWSVKHGLVQIVKKEFVAHDMVSSDAEMQPPSKNGRCRPASSCNCRNCRSSL